MSAVTRRAPARRAPAWVAAAASLLLIAPVLAGCGQGATGRGVVLLPAGGGGGTAHAPAGCETGTPAGSPTCETVPPNVGFAQLSPDDWNLSKSSSAAGHLDMRLDGPGTLAVRGAFRKAPPCLESTCIAPSANTWVRAYPSVLYGLDQCQPKLSPPASSALRLPVRVASLPDDLIGTTAYTARTPHVTYDIAYDMWLNASGTRSPCKTDGTVEVMVWTDYDTRALPYGAFDAGAATIPFAANGHVDTGQRAWSVYVSNVDRNGQTVPWGGTVWVVLNRSHVVKDGTVSVDLSAALSTVGSVLQRDFGWTDFENRYWLDTVPFGIEFGPQDGMPYSDAPSDFSLHLSSYCLVFDTTLADAGCAQLSNS